MIKCSFMNYVVVGSSPVVLTYISDFSPLSNKELPDIQVTVDCRFTLKHVLETIRTYSPMHHTNKYSKYSSVIRSVLVNGWMFVYKLNWGGFKFCCTYLIFRFRECFVQGVSYYSGNYRVYIHSEVCTWYDKNIQSNTPYRKVLAAQLNHWVSFTKWLGFCLWTKWLWVRCPLQSLKLQT